MSRRKLELVCLLLALLLAGCSKEKTAFSLTDALPGADALPGWTPAEVQTFDEQDIYNLVNGQADAYFAYNFEEVAVQDYRRAAGEVLTVEVWQLQTPGDAYGLFSASISGSPTSVGAGRDNGDGDPGRRLAFWQNRYYARLRARPGLDDAQLRELAEAISEALPAGSPGHAPALLRRLPPDGLVERSAIFFHQGISIQHELWLGEDNPLGLSQNTDGVLAWYDLDGAAVQLLLLQYPSAQAARDGLDALQNGPATNLAASDTRDDLLGAVFGALDQAAAEFLSEALGE